MTSQRTTSLAAAAEPPPPPPDAAPPTPAGLAATPERRGRGIGRAIGYAIALLPVALVALLALVAHGFLSPLTDRRISLVGLPAGFLAFAVLLLLTGIGVLAVRSIRQPIVVALVLVFTTLLAITIITFTPALILIAINLKT